jgi:outer membrane protein assembly factor BamE (lipoprotein component of BamABCDE complex)
MTSGVKVDQSKLASLQPGVTTFDEAVRLLGQPTNTSIQSDGTRSLDYTYIHAQANAANFIPYVGAFVGGATTENTTLIVNFDRTGKLTTYSSNQGSNAMGTGLVSGQRQ